MTFQVQLRLQRREGSLERFVATMHHERFPHVRLDAALGDQAWTVSL